MNNCFIKRKIYLTVLCSILFPVIVLCQSLEQTIEMAMHEKELKNYPVAEGFLLRALFFEEGPRKAILYRELGNCYFNEAEYGKAADNFERAFALEKNDSIRTELLFSKASAFLLQENYQYAFSELFNLPDSMSSSYFNYKKNFYLGVAYFGNGEFELSEKCFLNTLAPFPQEREALQEIFKKNKKVSRLKPRTAQILSLFLPGLGQFYAGDVRNGLNSLLINGLFLGLFTYVSITLTPLDATLSVLPWFQRYYYGGYKKAGIIAAERIKKKRTQLYNEIITLVASVKKQ